MYDEEANRTLLDVIAGSKAIDPQELLVNHEKLIDLELKLSELLSGLERKVLQLYLDGCSYQEISIELKRHEKSIDKDRKSTRLNSSHVAISYAVFCLKKKKNNTL